MPKLLGPFEKFMIFIIMKWIKDEIEFCKLLLGDGKTFLEIANLLGKTQNSVTKKLNRLGYKSGYRNESNTRKSKYHAYNWVDIQSKYHDGFSYRDLIKQYNLTPQAIKWGKENGYLYFRSISDALKLARKNGKCKESSKDGLDRYRQQCRFRFNVYDYSDKFDLLLIEQYGWYKAKNRGDNPNGVSRDHMYSVKEGFTNNVNPYIISHPANCILMRHCDNNRKNTNCSITLNELIDKINKWDKCYGQE